MRYGHLNVECLFLKKLFISQSGHFWSSVLVKIITKVYPKFIFGYKMLLDTTNKHKFSTFGLQLLKTSPKYWFFLVFLPFFRSSRPRRSHRHSKFWKVVEQKLFLLSVRNFLGYSSRWFLHISISPTLIFRALTKFLGLVGGTPMLWSRFGLLWRNICTF
jgi:hypothetical protein